MISQRLKVRDTRELLNPVTPPPAQAALNSNSVPSTTSARPSPGSTAQHPPTPPPMTVTHTTQGRGGQGSSRRDSGPVSKKQRLLESAAAEVREYEKQSQVQAKSQIQNAESQGQPKNVLEVERSQEGSKDDILAQVCSAVGIDSDLAESVVEETPSTHNQPEGVPSHLQYIRGSHQPPPGILLPSPRMRYHSVRPIHRVPYDNPLMMEETRLPYHPYPPGPHEPYLVSRLSLRPELAEHHSLLAQYPRVQYIRHPRPGPQHPGTPHLLPAHSPGGARHPLPHRSPTFPQHYPPALRHTPSRPLLHQETTLPMQDLHHAASRDMRHTAPHDMRHPTPHNLRHPAPHELRHPTPHDVRHSAPHNLHARHPTPHDMLHSAPHDLRHPIPNDLRHSAPHDMRHSTPHDLRRSAPHDMRHPTLHDIRHHSPQEHHHSNPPHHHNLQHPLPKDLRHPTSPDQRHPTLHDLRQPSPHEMCPAPLSLRHPSSHEPRHLAPKEMYPPVRHPLPQDVRPPTSQELRQSPAHGISHPPHHNMRYPSHHSSRHPLPHDLQHPFRELQHPSPNDLRHPSPHDTQSSLPHSLRHSSPLEFHQHASSDLGHPIPHSLRQPVLPPHVPRRLSADFVQPAPPALPHLNPHEHPVPRDLRHTYPPSLRDSHYVSNQRDQPAVPLPPDVCHAPPPVPGTQLVASHLPSDLPQASVVRLELSGQSPETHGLPDPQHYSRKKLTSTDITQRPIQNAHHYRPIQPKIPGVLQRQGKEFYTIGRGPPRLDSTEALPGGQLPHTGSHNPDQRIADPWVTLRTRQGSSVMTETPEPRRVMEPPPPCVELIPLGPSSNSLDKITPHTHSVSRTSTAPPQGTQEHNKLHSSSDVSTPHTLSFAGSNDHYRNDDQEKSRGKGEAQPSTGFTLKKSIFNDVRKLKSLIQGFSQLRPASEPPQGAFAATTAAMPRPSSLPSANQPDSSLQVTKLVTLDGDIDNPFMHYLKLALDDLVSVPEAAALQKMSSPVQLLACMVKCLQRFGAQPSKNPDPLQRLRENFLTVVRTCLSKDQLQTFGWTHSTPEQILAQLFQRGENSVGEGNGSVESCRLLSFTHDDPLDDDVFTPPPDVSPTCIGRSHDDLTNQATLHSSVSTTRSSPLPTAVTRQASPYGGSPSAQPPPNHKDVKSHPAQHPYSPTPHATPHVNGSTNYASLQSNSILPTSPLDRYPIHTVPSSTLPSHATPSPTLPTQTVPSSSLASTTVSSSTLSSHIIPSTTRSSLLISPLHPSYLAPTSTQPLFTNHHSLQSYPPAALYPHRPLYTTHQRSATTHTTSLRGGSYCVSTPHLPSRPYPSLTEPHTLTYPCTTYSNHPSSSYSSYPNPHTSHPSHTSVSSSQSHTLITQTSPQLPTSMFSHPNVPSTSHPSHSTTRSPHTSQPKEDSTLSSLLTTSHPVSPAAQTSSTPIKPKPFLSQSYPAKSRHMDPGTEASASLPPQDSDSKSSLSPSSPSATCAAKRVSMRRSPLPKRKAARGDSKRETSGRILRGEKRAERSKRTGEERRGSRTPVNGQQSTLTDHV